MRHLKRIHYIFAILKKNGATLKAMIEGVVRMMETKIVFPKRYRYYQDVLRKKEISKIEEETKNSINRLTSMASSAKNESQGYGIVVASGIIGMFITAALGSIPGNINTAMNGFIPIGLLIGIGVGFFLRSMRGSDAYDRANELEQDIEQAKAEQEERIEAVNLEYEKRYELYKAQFDQEVADRILRFSEDGMVKDVCDWAFHDFESVVLSTDRSSYITEIKQMLSLTVYRDRIRLANGKLFNFKKQNYLDLTSCMMQDVLAHIVGRELQFRIMERFPEDPSGTITEFGEEKYEYSIDIRSDYEEDDAKDAVVVDITYQAPNGNYVAPKGFGE